jgi:m7GpppX diphosphatase
MCILTVDAYSKTASVLGTIFDIPAVLTVEKDPFVDLSRITQAPYLSFSERNDVYRSYFAEYAQENSGFKATLIFPATEVHIRKHEKQKRHMVKETPEVYKEHVEKYIETMKGKRIQWYLLNNLSNIRVYNIIEHKAEEEKIIYEDPSPETGFLLLPDLFLPIELN